MKKFLLSFNTKLTLVGRASNQLPLHIDIVAFACNIVAFASDTVDSKLADEIVVDTVAGLVSLVVDLLVLVVVE